MVDIVVGGFYGDEGKGKIVGYLAFKDKYDYVVRAGGGPQAGHTVTDGMAVTQIPSGFVNKNSRLLVGRGTVISPIKILNEIEKYGVSNRIGIDYGCTVIEDKHIVEEKELVERIGSVGTGTGPARRDRVMRCAKLAKDVDLLRKYITDVSQEVIEASCDKKKVLIEGVQGYGLSLMNYKFYPNVTSQDTTAAQFAVDTGIGPKLIDEVIIIYKSYTSRVGKGPMPTEWNETQKISYGIEERGTVSGRQRRLGDFDFELAIQSLLGNTATVAAINCVDRLFPNDKSVKNYEDLSDSAKDFINNIDQRLASSAFYGGFKGVKLISTGPNLEDIVDLR